MFAMMDVVGEIFEFSMDELLGFDMQVRYGC